MDDAPILICYDGSEHARHAIRVAGRLLAGKSAVILSVAGIPEVPETYDVQRSDLVGPDRLAFDAALAQAEEGVALAHEAGFRAEARANIDEPTWRGVIEVADEVDAAIIVIGSRGLSGVQELLEGSLSHDVAENARRPVLIVPPPR